MQIDDRLGTFEELRAAAGVLAPLLDSLRAQVEDLHPEAVEKASRKEQTVSWGFSGGKMRAAYAYARAFSTHVNLGFFQGVHLPDPERLLKGTGKTLRHVKLRSVEDTKRPAVRELLIAARDERKAALNLN